MSWLLTLLAGCATAPAADPLADPLPLPESAPAPPPAPLPSPAPQNRSAAASVNGADGLTRLCEALRDEAAMTFPGNAVEQARAADAHAQQRQAALNRRYVTTLPSAGFAFRSYDLSERRLMLDTDRGLVLGDGAELFMPSKDAAPGFALGPDLADRLLAQRADGKVGLRLIFRPMGSQLRADTCTWLGGGRIVKLGIEIVAAALVAADGTVLARSDSGEYGDASLAVPVRAPKVIVNKPRTAEGRDLPTAMTSALGALADRAQPCYERVLAVRPGLRGTVVLALRIGANGRVETPRVEMSSLGDDAVTDCVVKAVAKTTINGAASGQHLSVPLIFRSAEE